MYNCTYLGGEISVLLYAYNVNVLGKIKGEIHAAHFLMNVPKTQEGSLQ